MGKKPRYTGAGLAMNGNCLYCRKCKISTAVIGVEIFDLVKTVKCKNCGGKISIKSIKMNRKFLLQIPREYAEK